MTHNVTVRYSDGVQKTVAVAPGQTILDAAEANGVPIVNECQSGICGTCVADWADGQYELGRTEGLSEPERESGKLLTCQARVRTDCVIDLHYPASANAASLVVGDAVVDDIELLSNSTAVLRVDASRLPEPLDFLPGQFAQLRVPGTDKWRNYSYAHAPRKDGCLEFIIRLLPDGAMSNYLRSEARVGDTIQLRGSKGSFYLRDVVRPIILIAGGTGVSAIMAIAERLVADGCGQPVRLYYGANHYDDLCKLDELKRLASRASTLDVQAIIAKPDGRWDGPVGMVTDLLDDQAMFGGEVDFYLCGPPPMVETARRWIENHGFNRAGMYYEKFLPSGASTAAKAPTVLDSENLDYGQIRKQGRGTAVVIGGSIAGIAAAKVLSERFEKVIVLEKDSGHHRREGRPGAAQGWHLHHLLIAGQRILETLFPGVIDDMVREGAFKVDMADQYRLYMGGSWKKVCKSGIEIVCAGRPLLEWCVRRRLDEEPNIDFRYDAEVQDLVYDSSANQILGVGQVQDGNVRVVPAEFVVDASGKNTRVPEILERVGVGAPEVERDNINCFYSTMQHSVPPDRQWDDKVMIICYAYRPHQETYSAQYYTDSSRRILSTSLVSYNCYSPPRNDAEFREFAKAMPNQVISKNLEGLEPCSPVYNFRYPALTRLKYEKMRGLPGGLVAIGDAYTSADPVSGAGMTKALMELDVLRSLLSRPNITSESFVAKYYKKSRKIADMMWFVVREQNLRYSWIQDVESKRPPFFGLVTWYMDRVTELIHDDMGAYRQFLAVVHFVDSPITLLTPRMFAKVVGKWLITKLRFRKTLIEKNFENGAIANYYEDPPAPLREAGSRPSSATRASQV